MPPPRAWVVSVGSELLDGRVREANSHEVLSALIRIGMEVERVVVLPDRVEPLAEVLREALGRVDAVVVTGGLGPTPDDLTRDAISLATGRPLEQDEASAEAILSLYRAAGRPPPPGSLRQAHIPAGSRVIRAVGTAPGFVVEERGTRIYCLPGVPREMRTMMERDVLPELRTALAPRLGPRPREGLVVAGLTESEVAERLEPLKSEFPGLDISYLAVPGEIRVELSLPSGGEDHLARAGRRAREVLGRNLVKGGLVEEVARLLLGRGETLAVAESLTGGWVRRLLTSPAGSSGFFLGGVIAYSTRAKEKLLGVSREVLAAGAVSREVVLAMADGVRQRFGAVWGLATTGAAGPEPHHGAPPGAFWVGVSGPATLARFLQVGVEREVVRELAARVALDLLRRALLGEEE